MWSTVMSKYAKFRYPPGRMFYVDILSSIRHIPTYNGRQIPVMTLILDQRDAADAWTESKIVTSALVLYGMLPYLTGCYQRS